MVILSLKYGNLSLNNGNLSLNSLRGAPHQQWWKHSLAHSHEPPDGHHPDPTANLRLHSRQHVHRLAPTDCSPILTPTEQLPLLTLQRT